MKAILMLLALTCSILQRADGQMTIKMYQIGEIEDYFKGISNLPINDLKAKEIYSDLCDYSNMNFTIYYVQTFNWGQARYGGIIFLDISALQKSTPILAFIMGHEWGHQALGHAPNIYYPYGNFVYTQIKQEDQADYYAGIFLASKGYDVQPVLTFLRNLPLTSKWDTHSSGKKRAQLVFAGYKSLKNTKSTNDLQMKSPYDSDNTPNDNKSNDLIMQLPDDFKIN
jgi:hypothetical protein